MAVQLNTSPVSSMQHRAGGGGYIFNFIRMSNQVVMQIRNRTYAQDDILRFQDFHGTFNSSELVPQEFETSASTRQFRETPSL